MLDMIASGIDEQAPADQPTPPARRDGPGALRGEVSLTLNTHQACNLFHGRRHVENGPAGIPGLYRFANHLDQIAVGAGSDDPYADWTIMRIEDLMQGCEMLMAEFEDDVLGMLKNVRGLQIGVASSIEPKVIELQLTSPYAHWGARLIGQYDALMTVILSARYVALLDEDVVVKTIQECSRAFRRFAHVAQDYRFSGVTRVDVEQKTARALEAAEKYGEVPEVILDGSFRPRFRYQAKSH